MTAITVQNSLNCSGIDDTGTLKSTDCIIQAGKFHSMTNIKHLFPSKQDWSKKLSHDQEGLQQWFLQLPVNSLCFPDIPTIFFNDQQQNILDKACKLE